MSVRDRVAIYSEKNLRSRVVRFTCVAAVLGFAACTDSAQHELANESSTTLEVSGDKQPSFSRALGIGTYLVEVRERDIDLRVLIDAAAAHAELEDEVPRHGVHFKVVEISTPTELRIVVRSADHPSKRGTALVRVARWRRAQAAPPSELELGYTAFGTAGEHTALATPESWARAADQLHEASTHFETARAESAHAQAEYALANLQYLGRDEWAAAVRAAGAAGDAYDAANDEVGVNNAGTVRAAAELELAAGMDAGTQRAEQRGLYESADRRLREAAEFFDAHELPIRAAYAVNMRGIRALNVGNYEEAGDLFEAAVARARANDDVGEEARSLGNLAWVNNRRGFIAKAAAEYAALLPLIDRDRQPYQYAAALGNYGFCLIALGDFDRASAMHTEALNLYTVRGKEAERATELAALGGLYFRLGDTERALETLRAASAAQEKLGDRTAQASTLRVAGNAASTLGNHQEAIEFLRDSAKIDGNTTSVARTRVLIAGELRILGDLRGAETELAAPLTSDNRMVHANALDERARLRIAQRNLPAAIADLRAADAQFKILGLDFNRIDTNTALSQALLATRDVAGASVAADEAVSIVNRIRVKSANPEWRARFLSARYSPYEARIAADFAAGATDDPVASWRGFRTAEEVRARSLADQLAFNPARGSSIETAGEAELRARLTSQQLRLETRMQKQPPDDPATLELRRAIEETRAQMDTSRVAVATTELRLPESLQELQKKLPPDTAVLAYFVGDAATHGWLLRRGELRHATLPGRVEIESSVAAVVGAQRRIDDARVSETRLSTILLGRLLDDVHESRMLVIPDGPLNALPFAALRLPGSTSDLLIDRFVLGYAPSLALALRTRHQSQTRPTRVAVISDPVYAPDDQRLMLAARESGSTLRGPPQPSANNLTRLPFSALEAQAVIRSINSADTIQLTGFDATPARVLELSSTDLAVLHFATHAVARRDAPEQSALYLSEYARDGSLMPESRLTASDIARRGLHAQVVVLSGCATADGGELRGEGVLGLTYGFLANGSRSVVAALWPVEDASTARFMEQFYLAYRASGRAADAVRIAQLKTRATAPAAGWSSFVVRANEFP